MGLVVTWSKPVICQHRLTRKNAHARLSAINVRSVLPKFVNLETYGRSNNGEYRNCGQIEYVFLSQPSQQKTPTMCQKFKRVREQKSAELLIIRRRSWQTERFEGG